MPEDTQSQQPVRRTTLRGNGGSGVQAFSVLSGGHLPMLSYGIWMVPLSVQEVV